MIIQANALYIGIFNYKIIFTKEKQYSMEQSWNRNSTLWNKHKMEAVLCGTNREGKDSTTMWKMKTNSESMFRTYFT